MDLAAERRNGDFVRCQIQQGLVTACHDLADGGLLIGIAEMAMSGGLGIAVDALPWAIPLHAAYFGEDQARYLIVTAEPEAVLISAAAAGVPAMRLGRITGATLTAPGLDAISVLELQRMHNSWLPGFMAAE